MLIRLSILLVLGFAAALPTYAQQRPSTETSLVIAPSPIRVDTDASFFAGVWSDSRTPVGEVVFRTPTSVLATAPLRAVPPGTGPISNGLFHTCALRPNGGIRCWGLNSSFQLGDGTFLSQRRVPTPVVRLPGPMIQVATGYTHTCALSEVGGAVCWGDRSRGQIGDGVSNSRFLAVRYPTPVLGLESGVIQVAAGYWHSCALTEAGAVLCWGDNTYGELGDGTYERSYVPVPVEGLQSGVVQISGTEFTTCALRDSGEVWCWGRNQYGQLGIGEVSHSSGVPVRVRFQSSATEIAQFGQHVCLLSVRALVWCWGHNTGGGLGNGTEEHSSLPVRALGLRDVVSLAQGRAGHSGAITRDGSFWCWGGVVGFCGTGNTRLVALTPVRATVLEEPIWSATVGSWTICVLSRSGEPGCWGRDVYGLLGIGSPSDQSTIRSYVPVRPNGNWNSWPAARAFARVDLGHDLAPRRHRVRAFYRPSLDFRRSSSPWVWVQVRR